MKDKILKYKNLVLLVLLILALGLTYLFEEKSNREASLKEAKKLALLDIDALGEITGIQGIKLDFERRGGFFYARDNNLRLSEARLDEFFQILSGLKIKTVIDQVTVDKVGLSFYIPDPSMKMTFTFERGSMQFILGKKLDYDQSFYMQVIRDNKSQVFIVNDESPDPGIYENDEEYKKSAAKYQRLQMVFLLTNKYFHDTRVFKDLGYAMEKINFKEITISTFRNKKYSLSFETSTTNPPVPKGLKYFDDNWVSFHQALTKLEGSSLYFPAEPAKLNEILSHFEIVDRMDRKYTLDVYKKYGEENGYFLKSSLDNIVYQLKPEDARYFFVNVQDFWQKRLVPENKDYALRLTFYNKKSGEVSISDKELFKVLPKNTSDAHLLRPLEFKKLLEFIKMEGDHVSELTESPSVLLKKNVLEVSFEKKRLNVILEDNDAIVVDFENKIKIHHYVGASLPFSIKYEDYFGTKK